MEAVGSFSSTANQSTLAQFNSARIEVQNATQRQREEEEQRTNVQQSGGSNTNGNLPPNLGRNVDISA
jgi:hypothetical protein